MTDEETTRTNGDVAAEIAEILSQHTGLMVTQFAICYDTQALTAAGIVHEQGIFTSAQPLWQVRALFNEGIDVTHEIQSSDEDE